MKDSHWESPEPLGRNLVFATNTCELIYLFLVTHTHREVDWPVNRELYPQTCSCIITTDCWPCIFLSLVNKVLKPSTPLASSLHALEGSIPLYSSREPRLQTWKCTVWLLFMYICYLQRYKKQQSNSRNTSNLILIQAGVAPLSSNVAKAKKRKYIIIHLGKM